MNMRLLSYVAGSRPSIGVEVDGQIVDLPEGFKALPAAARGQNMVEPPAEMLAFLNLGEPAIATAKIVADQFKRSAQASAGVVFPRDDVKILAPIAQPRKIFCLGLNYRDHAEETGSKIPEKPIVFSKMATAIIGPGDPIMMPRPQYSNEIDYEAEFTVVIGKQGKHIPREQALDYVAGYTILNDVSARDVQFSESQWLRAKSFDTFAPTGPYLVMKDEIVDPHDLDVKLWVNGELRQSSNTKHLIFGVDYLVEYLSRSFTLLPGDLISTGTPSGVGFAMKPPKLLKPGDVVRIEIAGLGVLENPVEMEA
jgi:acylpyruvate hydrolase